MLYIAGIIVSVYLLILFIAKPNKTIADKILTAWQFVATIHLGFLYLYVTNTYLRVPALIWWELPLPMVHGPFLFVYTLFITGQQKRKSLWLVNFILVVAAFILWYPEITMPAAHKLVKFKGATVVDNIKAYTYITAIIVSGLGYITACIVLLYRHKKNISSQFSYNEHINLNWLMYLISGIGIIWFFVIFYRTDDSLYISVALFIFFIGFFGIRQQGIFNNTKNPGRSAAAILTSADKIQTVAVSKPKYENSALKHDQVVSIFDDLQAQMTKQKLFKNPQLTLSEVAQILNISSAALSQVINTQANKTFYDYVNSLRVETFKGLIGNPENEKFTLLSLAFESGFNSKSAFNRNFKKITGLSPSAYLKENNIQFSDSTY